MLPLLLLLLLVGITLLFALQNLSPVVLTFLGIKSLAFPLGVWILLAIGAGFFSSLVIVALFRLSNYLGEQQLQSLISQLEAEKSSSNSRSPRRETTSVTDSASFKSEYQDRAEKKETIPDPVNYDREQAPTTTSRTGSVYSYSYRNPENSGVAKSESVYDAEYRVITPPYQAAESTDEAEDDDSKNVNKEEDDDWGFDDDDAFDDDNDRSRYR